VIDQPIFSEADELRLLQLQTRQSMAARSAREAAALDEESEADEPEVIEIVEVPKRWRLVPEGFSAHSWQQQCLMLWLQNARGTVKVATGGGKTLFALLAAQSLQNERVPDLRVIIVVPTIPLMRQWRDELSASNLPSSAIAMMGGGESPANLSEVRVLVAVLNSAREKLARLAEKVGWGQNLLLVVDECHRAGAKEALKIFQAHPAFTLGLSATPERDAQEKSFPSDEEFATSELGQAVGPIIFEFSLKDSLAAGLLTPFEIWHVGLRLTPEEAEKHAVLSNKISELRRDLQPRHRASKPKMGFIPWCQQRAKEDSDAAQFMGLTSERKRLLYRAAARISISLSILAEASAEQDGRTIVFHESIEEIEKLFLAATLSGMPAVLEHSKLPSGLRDSNIDVFRRGVAKVIISAKSLVEGFNVPSADLGIIAASSGSVRQRIQSLGRMLRRKKSGKTALVVVLYVRDTEDEGIYEKADWETVVGAESNRYFQWEAPEGDGMGWKDGLREVEEPPRPYRPSSFDVDVSTLKVGDPYPGQSHGEELKVDGAGNLRMRNDTRLVRANAEQIEAILTHNQAGYATRTPAGHLIVRTKSRRGSEDQWRFLGTVPEAEPAPAGTVIKLQVQQNRGKAVIALQKKGGSDFALGPGQASSEAAGLLVSRLLEWVDTTQRETGTSITTLYWDGGTSYWIEVQNSRHEFMGPSVQLEFKS
jgi:superfamily II DNA or RNA helicase